MNNSYYPQFVYPAPVYYMPPPPVQTVEKVSDNENYYFKVMDESPYLHTNVVASHIVNNGSSY